MQISGTRSSSNAIISYESADSVIKRSIAKYKPIISSIGSISRTLKAQIPTFDSLPNDALLYIFKYIPEEFPKIVLINKRIAYSLQYDILGQKTRFTYLFIQHVIIKTIGEETITDYGMQVFSKVVQNIRRLWVSMRDGFALTETPVNNQGSIDVKKTGLPFDLVTYEQIIEKIVKYIPHIEHLSLSHFSVNNLFNHLSGLKKLTSLVLNHSMDLSKIPALKGVRFSEEQRTYTPTHLEPLSFLQLQNLTLINSAIDETLPIFGTSHLRNLCITQECLSTFEQIISIKNLKTFTMRTCGEFFNSKDILKLSSHPSLEKFNWTRVPFHVKPSGSANLPDNTSQNNQSLMNEFKKLNPNMQVNIS